MKNVFLLIVLLLTISCSKKDNTYHITGTVEDIPTGKVYLEKLDLNTNGGKTLDSTEIKDGKFELKGEIGSNSFVGLKINDTVKIPFFLEEKVNFMINTQKQKEVKIEGGIENQLFKEHEYAFERKHYPLLIKNANTAFAAFSAYYFVQQVPVSKDSIKTLVSSLKDRAKSTEYFPHLQKVSDAIIKTSIGEIAPDFSSKNVKGESKKLSDFKGKNIMLEFWASWCAPCRANNPKWQKIYEKYKGPNFEMISVSFDTAKDCQKWKDAIIKDQMTWIHLSNCTGWNEISDLYGIKSVPTTYLIDKNGKILAKNFEPEDFENIYKKLIK